MTEYNYFCWAKKYNDKDSFQQKRYRVFNVEVGEEEYNKISKLYDKLEFDPNENYTTRFQTAFKKMWNSITPERQQEYLNIPHFNWEGFTFITGITPEDVKENMVGKEDGVIIFGTTSKDEAKPVYMTPEYAHKLSLLMEQKEYIADAGKTYKARIQ